MKRKQTYAIIAFSLNITGYLCPNSSDKCLGKSRRFRFATQSGFRQHLRQLYDLVISNLPRHPLTGVKHCVLTKLHPVESQKEKAEKRKRDHEYCVTSRSI